MASSPSASPLRFKALLRHGRSLSFPASKLHPPSCLSSQSRTTISEPTTCSSLSSMEKPLSNLRNLYCNIHAMLMLPYIQDIITSQESQEKWFDRVLDGYIRLLDACTTAKDILSQTKQDMQELLSALRRKDMCGIDCYQRSRRDSKKMIQKSLKCLRIFKSENEKDQQKSTLICVLKETEGFTICVLESLLSYLMGTKVQSRKSGWSLGAKLMFSNKASDHHGEETDLNEFKKVDALLQLNQEDADASSNEGLMNHLKEMDSSIQNLEEELEFLFRHLIKTRVFLLNILNH